VGALSERRSQTSQRISQLQTKLEVAAGITAGKACVYATGSYGRGEASTFSDLDLFIVSLVETKDGETQSVLRRLDEILLKAQLINATRQLDIKEFDGDGRWLVGYSVDHLTKTLGKPEDDALNTFTARLLLLLESHPLLEDSVYAEVMNDVIDAYWRDYSDHKDSFVPAFLTNDILRLWRTFCVNYEANTFSEPTTENAKRKSKNYKLKHSRLLTCFSALMYLLAVFEQKKTVHPSDVIEMTKLTPTGRIDRLLASKDLIQAHSHLQLLLDHYERFLETTNVSDAELREFFLDRNVSREYMKRANEFGKTGFDALTSIGNENLHFRIIQV
jgi:hypothetical protein